MQHQHYTLYTSQVSMKTKYHFRSKGFGPLYVTSLLVLIKSCMRTLFLIQNIKFDLCVLSKRTAKGSAQRNRTLHHATAQDHTLYQLTPCPHFVFGWFILQRQKVSKHRSVWSKYCKLWLLRARHVFQY